jgi:outer membrane protein assembly factor BamB
MRKKLIVAAAAVVLAGAGAAVAYALLVGNRPEGKLDTVLAGVSVETFPTTPAPTTSTIPTAPATTETEPPATTATTVEPEEGPCWEEFGGNLQRTLSRVTINLGVPRRNPVWARAMGTYMEYPPSFCDGTLYVNTYGGRTVAVDAATGRFIWSRQDRGLKPSTPAIAGSRLIVSSLDGTVSGVSRANGHLLWRLDTGAKVESSPAVVDDTAYFGATDGRLFAVNVATGRVRWAYNTGGRINSSPSIWGNRICITTYAGSIFCLDRRNGTKLWSTYVKRDAFRYESFYASPSTDGRRLFTTARSGKVVALDATNGHILWTQTVGTPGYPTPAVAYGRVFVGGWDGVLRSFRADTGALQWRVVGDSRIIAPAMVAGNLVFFSTYRKTYAVRVGDGKVVWRFNLGKYSPGIVTDRHYYMSLNGLLLAFEGTGR